MARSKREKSASVSSATAPIVNGSMLPPSSSPVPVSARTSPTATRRKAPSVSRVAGSSTTPSAKSAHAPVRPSNSKFVLAVIISLVAEAAGQTGASVIGAGELASISKLDASPYETGGLLAWKILLLGICWYGGLDGMFELF